MSAKLTVRLIFFVGMFVAALLALFTQQIWLLAPYVCLGPWIGIWLGRATIGMFRESRFVRISPTELEALDRLRQHKQGR